MLGKFKEILTKSFAPAVNVAVRIGLTPNRITVLGFILSIVVSVLIVGNRVYPVNLINEWQRLILASLTIFAMGFCDLLDGLVARKTGKITVFGGFLDSVLDRYTEVFIFAALIIGGYCHPIWGIVTMVGALLVSYARARAEAAGLKNLGIGIAERPERLAVLGVAILAQGIFLTSWFPTQNQIIYWTIILLAFLTHFTVIQRFYYAYKRLPKTPTVEKPDGKT